MARLSQSLDRTSESLKNYSWDVASTTAKARYRPLMRLPLTFAGLCRRESAATIESSTNAWQSTPVIPVLQQRRSDASSRQPMGGKIGDTPPIFHPRVNVIQRTARLILEHQLQRKLDLSCRIGLANRAERSVCDGGIRESENSCGSGR